MKRMKNLHTKLTTDNDKANVVVERNAPQSFVKTKRNELWVESIICRTLYNACRHNYLPGQG